MMLQDLQSDRSMIPDNHALDNTPPQLVAYALLAIAAFISFRRAINSGYKPGPAAVLAIGVHFVVVAAAAIGYNTWAESYYGANVELSQTTWIYGVMGNQTGLVVLLVMIPVPVLLCYIITASSQRRQQPQAIVYRS